MLKGIENREITKKNNRNYTIDGSLWWWSFFNENLTFKKLIKLLRVIWLSWILRVNRIRCIKQIN